MEDIYIYIYITYDNLRYLTTIINAVARSVHPSIPPRAVTQRGLRQSNSAEGRIRKTNKIITTKYIHRYSCGWLADTCFADILSKDLLYAAINDEEEARKEATSVSFLQSL